MSSGRSRGGGADHHRPGDATNMDVPQSRHALPARSIEVKLQGRRRLPDQLGAGAGEIRRMPHPIGLPGQIAQIHLRQGAAVLDDQDTGLGAQVKPWAEPREASQTSAVPIE